MEWQNDKHFLLLFFLEKENRVVGGARGRGRRKTKERRRKRKRMKLLWSRKIGSNLKNKINGGRNVGGEGWGGWGEKKKKKKKRKEGEELKDKSF